MGDLPGYDAWKLACPYDEWDGEDEDGCTCPRTLGAGGARMTGEWCPVHGKDPDDERDKRIEDREY